MENEILRLQTLKALNILDTESEQDFDELVSLASAICGTPISLVTLIDENRQWFKAKKGLMINETPREIAFCNHAIGSDELFVVSDAESDERFKNNPLVTDDPNIRFYAGMPLITKNGLRLGTLCVIDRVPRALTKDQEFALNVLSKQAMRLIEQRKTVDELALTLGSLKEANAQKDKIFGIIAHDLRSPINGLNRLLSIYHEDEMEPDEIAPFLQKLTKQVAQTSVTLDNLLQWAASQINNAVPQISLVNLYVAAKAAIDNASLQIADKELNIVCNIAENTTATADKHMVDMVIRNLLANAIKFSHKGGEVHINEEISQTHVKISIKDFGVGMSAEVIDKLLSNKHVTTYGTSNEKGTGLGLLLCREYLQKNNGKLIIESQVNVGSTLSFTLPIY